MTIEKSLDGIVTSLEEIAKEHGRPLPEKKYEFSNAVGRIDYIRRLIDIVKNDMSDTFIPFHICTYSEYDATTHMPTVSDPDEGTIYMVPTSVTETGNLFDEWVYVDSSWEHVGSTTIDVSALKQEISEYVVDEIMDEVEASIPTTVTGWLNDHVNPESDVVIDDSLSINGAAADAAKVGELKSAIANMKPIEYSEKTNILGYSDISFANATDGMLQSNGTVSGSTAYCVSDYLPLAGVKKMFRHNIATKYNFEAYALYDSEKNMISGTYHGKTTNYELTTYLNYNYVLFYDISANGAAYIRITKDKTLSYLYTQEYVDSYNYAIDGDIMANNIQATEESVTGLVDLTSKLNEKKLAAKSFVLFRSDRDTVFDHTYINYRDGSIITGDAYNYKTSDYIPAESETLYATGNGYSYACYSANKSLLSYGRLFNPNGEYRGTQKYWFTTTPAGCAYIRICMQDVGLFGLQKVPTEYDVLCLGDSIFGANPACFDISSIAQEKTGYNIANSGFGGSQASTYPSVSSPYYSFNFWKLADAIYDEDYTEQDASAADIEISDGSILYVPRLTILKSVDFTKLKMIVLGYGTNDCSKHTVLDNENDKYDKTTYCGAIRYGMEKIWSKYPAICFVLLSPPYGRKGTNNEYSTDTWMNGIGLKLMDYVDALKDLAAEYHVAFFDRYTNMGVNDYNWETYLRDGTHLSYTDGADLFGAQMANAIDGILSEY